MKNWARCSAMCMLLGIFGVAQPGIHITIPLPPPILFHAPPSVVLLPETQVYVVPGITEEIFFHSGWWWRPWQGRWYRSRYYDRGWIHYSNPPYWYRGIPPRWRDDYRDHRWGAGAWNHRPIPHEELHRNWRSWNDTRHWEQPQYRQHETRRDGRPYAAHEPQGRRPDSDMRNPVQVRPVQSYPPVHGYSDHAAPPKVRSEGRNPNRGHSGGPGRSQEPRRDPH